MAEQIFFNNFMIEVQTLVSVSAIIKAQPFGAATFRQPDVLSNIRRPNSLEHSP